MKRKAYFILCIVICFIFVACGSDSPVRYVQREGLPRPDSIEAETGSATLAFRPGDAEYERLYETLMQNWWLTVKDTPDTAAGGELVRSEGLHALKTKTGRTYRQVDDNYAIFHYEDGIDWTDFEGKSIQVKSVFFLIPKHMENTEHIKGYFSASESGEIGVNEGMYTFYYPAEMTDGFFHWVMHTETEPDLEQQTHSQEQAMLAGFVVMQDGDVRHNAGKWFEFLEICQVGQPARVTIAQYAMGDSGTDDRYYEVSFDGSTYTVVFEKDGHRFTDSAETLTLDSGLCNDTMEPYDSYVAYSINDILIYRDLIAEPDYEGVAEIFLYAKEGESPHKSYTDPNTVDNILQLLMTAEYMPVEPENYLYGMKLLMTNRDGKDLVIELDLQQGNYRYGMQTYAYGEISDLFATLDINQWPDSVMEEFGAFLN